MLKAVFFDFDGVIHNTFDFHRNKVTEFTGIDLSEDEYKDMHNGNFYDHKINKLKGVNWSAYPKYIHAEHSKLEMEQEIKEALCALHKRYRLFIVSSGGGPRIVDYLKNNGVAQLFTEVLGLEFNLSKIEKFKHILAKYQLALDESVFITDTLGDILEANAVNLKTIAVTFGYHDKETLSKGNPFRIVSSVNELVEAIG